MKTAAKNPESNAQTKQVSKDPEGSFFDPITDEATHQQLIAAHSPAQRQLLALADPEEMLLSAMSMVGVLPPSPEPGDTSSDAETHRRRRIAARHIIRVAAKEYQQPPYWTDFAHRRGQGIDQIEQLYEQTEELGQTSALHTLFAELVTQHRSNEVLSDAFRTLKIALLHEKARR